MVIQVSVTAEVEIADEDLEGYDFNVVNWANDNVNLEIEADNFDWWIDSDETMPLE